jgi:hypothetical protein
MGEGENGRLRDSGQGAKSKGQREEGLFMISWNSVKPYENHRDYVKLPWVIEKSSTFAKILPSQREP